MTEPRPRVPSPHSASPEPADGETPDAWTDRLAREGSALGVYRQCSIGWHMECSTADDGEDAACRCLCHVLREVTVVMPSGAELILRERIRQMEEEGYDDVHDARQVDQSLPLAAACYAVPPEQRKYRTQAEAMPGDEPGVGTVPTLWPWHSSYWKPEPADRVRELVKAGALIAAEIDRLHAAGGAS